MTNILDRSLPRGLLCSAIVLLAFGSRAQAAEPSKSDGVHVLLDTSAGSIEVEVFPDRAPLSACDFLAYVDAGLYEHAAFYRVVRNDNDRGTPKIDVIQGGLRDESKERPPIAHETTQMTGLTHIDGALSLARGAVGTGSAAAFFIVIGPQPGLDFGGARHADKQGFAVFGRVVRGMETVRRIHQMRSDAATDDAYTKGQLLNEPVAIKKAARVGPASSRCKS